MKRKDDRKKYRQGPPIFARGLELPPGWVCNAPVVHRSGECHCRRCMAAVFSNLAFSEPVAVSDSKPLEKLQGHFVGVYAFTGDLNGELNKRDYPIRHEAPKVDAPAFDDLDLFGDGNGKPR